MRDTKPISWVRVAEAALAALIAAALGTLFHEQLWNLLTYRLEQHPNQATDLRPPPSTQERKAEHHEPEPPPTFELLDKEVHDPHVQASIQLHGSYTPCRDSQQNCFFFEEPGLKMVFDPKWRLDKFVFSALKKYPAALPFGVYWHARKKEVRANLQGRGYLKCRDYRDESKGCWQESADWLRLQERQYRTDFQFESEGDDDAFLQEIELIRLQSQAEHAG